MEKIKNVVDGVRIRLRGLYDGPLGAVLPTRQVLGAGLAGLLATFIDEIVPGLEVSDALVAGVATLVVGYLLGPPKVGDPETFQLVPKGHVVGLIPEADFDLASAQSAPDTEVLRHPASRTAEQTRSAAGSTSLPEVEGEFVGPEDDDTEPGRFGLS